MCFDGVWLGPCLTVTQTITLGDGKMTATMKVTNAGKEAFDFTGSFHTYLAADIESVAVGGLEAGPGLSHTTIGVVS